MVSFLEQPSQCEWVWSLACLSELFVKYVSPLISSARVASIVLKLQSPAKHVDLGIWLPRWELMRSPKGYVKCEQLIEKKPEKVFCCFSQYPVSKTGHARHSILLGSEGA